MPADLAAAREFVRREARVVEQRLYATLFEQAPPAGVTRALEAYRNEDGGFGHGLEPDKRCPESQPVDVAFALELLVLARAPTDQIVPAACDYLAGVADERGAVPLAFRSLLAYPHAGHWDGDWPYVPSLWATVAVASSLYALGADHPWLERATAYALAELAKNPLDDAHAVREASGSSSTFRTGEPPRSSGRASPQGCRVLPTIWRTPAATSTACRRSRSLRALTVRPGSCSTTTRSQRISIASSRINSPMAAGRCAGSRRATPRASSGEGTGPWWRSRRSRRTAGSSAGGAA